MNRIFRGGLLLIASVFCAGSLFAQSTGTIVGTVTDPAGSAVPSAQITITNNATGSVRTLQSNATGAYSAADLRNGTYTVQAVVPGFKTYERTNVVLDVDATLRIDVLLQVGATRDSITVEANALQVQSDTNEVSTVITGQQITQLDTNGRNPIQLATLVPGASASLPDFNAPTALSSNNNISFNGQRPQHNLWMIDGGENYDRGSGGGMIVSPSPDSLAEFRVLASNYSAEYGQASGGTVSIALKSGTKDFHGGAWEFFRNDALDANNFFSNESGSAKPELRYNAFGFNIGGPVFIPKVYNQSRQKTFFFYNQEWRRLIQGGEILVPAVPAAELTGNFGGFNKAITVPQTTDPAAIAKFAQFGLVPGQAFPGNVIPSGLIDPNAALVVKAGLFPSPNAPNSQFSQAAPVPTDLREEIVRIDHQFTDNLAIMGHLIYDSSQNNYATSLWASSTYPTVGTLLTAPSYSAVVHLTQTINPTLLNEVSYNFNGNVLSIVPTGNYAKPAGYNVQELFPSNTLNRLPQINIGSPYGVNYQTASWPWNNDYRSHQVKDDLSWNRGNHNLKFGGSWQGEWKKQDIFGNTNGNYNFNGNATGNSFSDFLLGYASSYNELDIQDAVSIFSTTLSFYGVDNWHVSKRLTINLGARYEYVPHAYDQNGRLANFYPGLYNQANRPQFNADGSLNPNGPGFSTVPGISLSSVPFYLNGVGLAGKNGIPQGLVKNTFANIAPRVGFAYDLAGDQKTIVRGGFGMFYERIQGNDVYNMGPNPPFSFNPSPNNVYFSNPSVSDQTGLQAAAPTFPGSFTALAYTDYKLPTSMQYSFQLQRQLGQATVASIGYVGSSNYHQPDVREINPVPINDPNRLAICGANCGYTGTVYNANLDRMYPGFSNISLTESSTHSVYNSLQISVMYRAIHGLTLQGAYTYSHEIDDTTGDLNQLSDPFNRELDRASGDFDRRHVAVFSYVYELPFFRNSHHAAVKSILGGWELSGITMFETGTPLNITLSYDNLGLGGGTTSRPNVVSGVSYPQTVNQWFNPGSFTAPAPLQFGDAGRNSLYGPGRDNWNMSLFKAFQFSERARLEFRFESYNTFNHTQFNGVNTTFGNSNFGSVNSVYDPRVLQLGAKFLF